MVMRIKKMISIDSQTEKKAAARRREAVGVGLCNAPPQQNVNYIHTLSHSTGMYRVELKKTRHVDPRD